MSCDLGDDGDRRAPPTPHFSTFVANKTTYSIRPKGDPGVTLGCPRRHPGVTQGSPNPSPRPNPKQAEGHKVKAPCFAAHAVAFSGQKLRANSQKPNCQISFPAHTLRREGIIPLFVRPCKRELGHALTKQSFGTPLILAQCFLVKSDTMACVRREGSEDHLMSGYAPRNNLKFLKR